MWKFSVKKPLTVFVAVIAVLVLGVVAFTRMTPDLLPNMDFPYVIIVTTYPGASPEKVETEISKPMEQAMSTLEHIQQVSSTSSENASMVMLEFQEKVNMDTIGVDIQQKITSLSAGWEDTVGAPIVLKINPSMLPVEVAAVSMEGKDTIALTEFLDETLMNRLEGIPGVARITATGKIQKQLHVVLEQEKIDALNEKIIAAVNGELDDAQQELEEQKQDLQNAKGQMSSAQSKLDEGKDALIDQTAAGEAELNQKQAELLAMKTALNAQIVELQTVADQLTSGIEGLKKIPELRKSVAALEAQIQGIEALQAQLEGQPTYAELQADVAAKTAAYEAAKAAYEAGIGTKNEESLEAAMLEAEGAMNDANQKLADRDAQYTSLGLEPGADLAVALVTTQGNYQAAKAALTAAEAQLGLAGVSDEEIGAKIAEYEAQLATTNAAIAELQKNLEGVESGEVQLQEAAKALQQAKAEGMLEISIAAGKLAGSSASLDMALQQIESGMDTIEDSREDALRQSDLNKIITMDMVTQILTAQNFAMPAGYVEQEGVNYMVSIGDEITDLETLQKLLLFDLDMEGVDPIYLKDVATVMVTDNRNETYAKLNGQDSVMLSFEKQSTYATAETTNNIQARFRQLEQEYPGLQFVVLMNQGDYIYLIVNSILSSLLLGAVFAILVLYLFLWDLRPTFITLCAIPISVIFAIVLM